MSEILPAGVYFVGDPCYVFDNDWHGLLHATDTLSDGCHEYKGHKLYSHGTAYGDGCYDDQLGNCYGVDSGCLGVVPKELWENLPPQHLGLIVTFEKPFVCSYEEVNGVVVLGHIRIETDPPVEEDDDSYDEHDDSSWHDESDE